MDIFEDGKNEEENFQNPGELPDLLSERRSPLGANYDDAMSTKEPEVLTFEWKMKSAKVNRSSPIKDICHNPNDISRLRHLEEEQELLTSSLLALTSHFAHVQLRVRQIVEATPEKRDRLLEELNDFAFQGIPESISPNVISCAPNPSSKDKTEIGDMKSRQRQYDLIEYLKAQLSELEKLAYESGAPVLPQNIVLKKQKIIIDELRNKLNLKLEDHELSQLSSEELIFQVDNAIGEFIGPLKMKEQLVAQLKTQITDLERFIFFLQCESDDTKMNTVKEINNQLAGAYNSYAAKKKQQNQMKRSSSNDFALNAIKPSCSQNSTLESHGLRENLNTKAHSLMDKASILMQIFASTHLTAKPHSFKQNILKKTSKGDHWGDIRAQLELDIEEVAALASTLSYDREKLKSLKQEIKCAQNIATKAPEANILATVQPISNKNNQLDGKSMRSNALSSDSDDDTYHYNWNRNIRTAQYKGDSIGVINRELTILVRKSFAMTLQRLIQHGLREKITSVTSSIMIPFLRCLNPYPSFTAQEESFPVRDLRRPPSFAGNNASEVSESGNHYGEHYNGGNSSSFRPMHAWELILEYYYLKNGDEYNNTPARKLSNSFNLDIVDSKAVTAKQNLLTTIGNIIAMHQPYKRSYTAHFKAFVCAGLNSKHLTEWLELIFSCSNLIDIYYTSNSYVMRTGFRDSLRSIDILKKYDFCLPVDLAVQHFENI